MIAKVRAVIMKTRTKRIVRSHLIVTSYFISKIIDLQYVSFLLKITGNVAFILVIFLSHCNLILSYHYEGLTIAMDEQVYSLLSHLGHTVVSDSVVGYTQFISKSSTP